MALRQLMISKKIQQRKSSLDELLTQEADLNKRAADLETAIEEAKTDEEIATVEEAISTLDTEKEELEGKKTTLEGEIAELEDELEELNNKEPKNEPAADPTPAANTNEEKNERNKNLGGEARMGVNKLSTRGQIIERLNRDEVRCFYSNLKQVIEQRSITGLDLTIPQILLDTITDDLGRYSVLYDLVRVARLTGKGRAIIAGEAPQAVWTEMVGRINELSCLFTDVEVDGYKVGGFIPLDNSYIEDSMINLASHVEECLKESIAIALDKAILYGTGTKMPLGIIPALNANADLKAKNIVTLTAANTKFEKIIETMKNIKRGRRGRGPITVVMNESTWLGTIVPMSIATNASGAFVTVSNQAFPGVGYKVVFSEEVPENNILVGDFTKYLLAERADIKGASSTEFLFTDDKTIFKATARYDGKPVRESAYVLIGLNGAVPEVSKSFAVDEANAVEPTA
ncbi:HK97 family phage major capsid protein [Clostridium beijerinckii]|uniref:phage major capsid protein n=1 Tax=Clostridium beijerinckii TaxID=1520 RepID=UPI001493FEBE|nr:phage major capsid protein [Clostridium beijerinckii]NOW86771.1 HK97 family phage major capsid protein [Clostridium beijerinckii]